jgi:uncharacterized membrane protein
VNDPPANTLASQSIERTGERVLMEAASFTGPLPPPGVLKGYEDALPGSAERIISMAEKYGDHRRALEVRATELAAEQMRRDYGEARMGQLCALAIALAFVGAGTWVALAGHPWPGATLGGGGVVLQTLVATFVRGRRKGDDSEQPQTRSSSPRQ